MFSLPAENWYRLLAWMALGFAIYFLYGYRNSQLRHGGVASRGHSRP
jgi:APA family basic amino acid/polyamine antiporter